MSLAELNSWLLTDGIGEEIDVLTRVTVRTELDNLTPDMSEDPAQFDWPRLLLAGSILARSELRSHQETALRIATGAVTLDNSQPIKDAGAVLLDKLSNFRAIDLASNRELLKDGLDERLGMVMRMEMQRRQLEHSVLVESSGRWLPVNEFQQRFWDKASKHTWLSASAPTASGKTFLVLHWMIDHMRSTTSRIVVYLAPTRALVAEIENELSALLEGTVGIEVSSLPLREKFDAAKAGGSKLVLIFTQERLHILANLIGDEVNIDLVIIDEAHKIGDNQRGVILQEAIERLERANPQLKLVFISPATQNPEELLADAPSEARTAAVDSDAHRFAEPHCCRASSDFDLKKW